jgi:hypothetical protein
MGGRSRPTEADLNRWREEVRLARKATKVALDALVFYADPETYFAISYSVDSLAGAFMKDFGPTDLGTKPGKRARRAIDKLAALMPARSSSPDKEGSNAP